MCDVYATAANNRFVLTFSASPAPPPNRCIVEDAAYFSFVLRPSFAHTCAKHSLVLTSGTDSNR